MKNFIAIIGLFFSAVFFLLIVKLGFLSDYDDKLGYITTLVACFVGLITGLTFAMNLYSVDLQDKSEKKVEKTFYSMLEQHNNFPNQYKIFIIR